MTDLRAQVLTTAAEAATQATQAAADSCLSAPKGATPSGSHWYYRIDRVTKRQCWYLREESDTADDKFARAAPPASAPAQSSAAAEPAPPQQRTITRKSIADARAEWISQQHPRRAELARQSRAANGCGSSPHRPCRMARAQPCRTCSRQRRCRRCDGMTLPPYALRPIQPISSSPPPTRPQSSRQQAEEVQLPAADQAVPVAAAERRRQSRPHRCRSCFW